MVPVTAILRFNVPLGVFGPDGGGIGGGIGTFGIL